MSETEKPKRKRPTFGSPLNALRPDAFCQRLGIGKGKYSSMKRNGEIKTIKLGSRTVFIPMEEVLRLEEGKLPEEAN